MHIAIISQTCGNDTQSNSFQMRESYIYQDVRMYLTTFISIYLSFGETCKQRALRVLVDMDYYILPDSLQVNLLTLLYFVKPCITSNISPQWIKMKKSSQSAMNFVMFTTCQISFLHIICA